MDDHSSDEHRNDRKTKILMRRKSLSWQQKYCKMEQFCLAIILTFVATVPGTSALRCYQCYVNPPPGQYYNTTNLCVHFDHTSKYVVDCPYSTMCMKKEVHLEILNGVKINGIMRDCAPQKHEFQAFKDGKWYPKMEILEPYTEGCQDIDDKGERTSSSRYCYCRSDLCNSSPNNNHEGYTDIMGVIVVFNLMKYINSLR